MIQTRLRKMENGWWTRLAEEMQRHADMGSQKEYYDSLKSAYSLKFKPHVSVRSSDGDTLIKD